jgi:cytochrome c oxidase cbb3-type subunit 4
MTLTFESLSAFAASWGSVYFAVLFLIAVGYAMLPSRKEELDHAARIPLTED